MTGKGRKATAPRIGYGAIPLLAIVVGCTGNQTTASRSAAAYDEARRQGIPIETHGAEHGGHGAAKPAHDAADVPGMDHHTAPEERAERAAAHQRHGAHDGPQVQGPPSHGEHTATPRTKRDMSGEAHAGHEATGAHTPAEGVDHSGTAGMAMAPRPEPKLAAAEPGDPAATLQPDDIDRPAPTSLEEAARSQAMNAGMAAGGHGMGHGTYKHIDAGREGAASPEGGGHQHHQTPEPRPSPSPGQQRPQQHEHGSAQQPGRLPPSPPGPQPW